MSTLKRRMEQLINGRFEYEVPGLVLSETEITVTVKSGENYRGELYIGSEDHRRIKGMVMSSNRRLLLAKEKFSGNTVCIPYGIDVKGLSEGDTVHAMITVNSNLGEYQIPVKVEVTDPQIKTSKGEIRTLDEFVKLAQSDYREAYHLYISSSFPRILQGEDRKYLTLYRGMSRPPAGYQNMEEFLIGTGKKEPVYIHLEKEEKSIDRIGSTIKDSVYLYRSTWGFTSMEVEVRGDFLEVEKKVLTSEDFIGSSCELEYLVRKEKLGNGRKYGQILIRTAYGTLIYHVTASGNSEYRISTHLFEKKAQARLALFYEKYRLGELDSEEWREETEKELDELKNLGCFYPKYQLMEAFLYYRLGEISKTMTALWPLRETRFTQEQMEEEAVYLALACRTGVATEEQREYADSRVANLYQMNPGSRILLSVLFEISEEYKNSDARQLYMLEEIHRLGCTSPFLYLDAYEKIAKEESHLKKLSPFMVQVLSYAAKHGMLTEELTLRIGHLSEYVKTFRPVLYRLLVRCYEAYPGKNLVDNICKYIMKGNPRKKEYFRWYDLAVEHDIRITRLYEYYIETMPTGYQSVLPQVIRMYFVYNNTLSSKKRASVYANVIRNKEVDKTTYQSYRKSMEQFALEALQQGRISEDYATIYQECIDKITSQAMGKAMAQVIFTYRIYCDNPRIRNVIVCHEEMEQEERYPCNDGAAYIRLFTPDARILFEDEKQKRYAVTVEYNLQKLMDEKEYVKQCVGLDVDAPGLLLYVCGGGEKRNEITVKNLGCYQHVVQMDAFREEYRHRVCRKILEYYAGHAGDDTLDSYLRKMDYLTFAQVDKVLLTEILIEKGMYERAFAIVNRYGYEGIRTESLVKLTSRMILRTEFVEQEELVYLAFHVFEEGKYDDIILSYLSDNLLGPVEQMALLWERMKGFQLDTYALEEEILLLAMFGRVSLPEGHRILKSYIRQKGKQQVILAYLSFCAYDYFLGGKDMDGFVFECLEICCEREWELDRICRLALLKYYSAASSISEKQDRIIRMILEECSETGLRFAFYSHLPSCYTKPYQMDDKQFVEERFPAKAKVTIHYSMDSGREEPVYKSEPMKNMYQGIFVKEFLLFYGETLRYYMTVEQDGESRTTEEKTLMLEDTLQEGNSKYQLLNRMLAGQMLSRDEQTENAMKQYLERERLAEKMFRLMN
ncbi:MAG: hypothetical protein KH828_12310 [Clostridiales bacterium]|nr:hypothetical protein [Clostridiales bacterium]